MKKLLSVISAMAVMLAMGGCKSKEVEQVSDTVAGTTASVTETTCHSAVEDDSFVTIAGKEYSIDIVSLDLSNQNLSNEDIRDIGKFNSLEQLDLSGNNITDISPLSAFSSYEHVIYLIDLSGNKIDDFKPLSDIKIQKLFLENSSGSNYETIKGLNAGSIWLDGNDIENIEFLVGNSISTLFLNDNNISDWSPLLKIENLRWVYTFNNPIEIPDDKALYDEKEITLADSPQYAYPY